MTVFTVLKAEAIDQISADLAALTSADAESAATSLATLISTLDQYPTTTEMTAAILAAITAVNPPTESIGSWTPTLGFNTNGDATFVYNSPQIGSYRRFGDLVNVSANFNTVTINHTTASGNLSITNLPYTVSAVAGEISDIPIRWKPIGLNLPRMASNLRFIVVPGTTKADLAFDTPYKVNSYNAYDLTPGGVGSTEWTPFKIGELITGGTSGATAIVDYVTYSNIAGSASLYPDRDQTLYLRDIVGTFSTSPNEVITGNAGGAGKLGATNSVYANGSTAYVTASHIVSGSPLILQASSYKGIIL